MSVGYFADLDGTTIFGRRFDNGGQPVIAVEHDADGAATSWMLPEAAEQLAKLRAFATFIPTTTRVRRQYGRITIPGVTPRVAIVANGMMVLRDGVADPEWSAYMNDPQWGFSPLANVMAEVEHLVEGAPWLKMLYAEDGIGVVIAKTPAGAPPDQAIMGLEFIAHRHGYCLWPQGKKTYLIPAHASKERGAAYVARELGITATAAAGDTTLDHGMLLWADYGLVPAHGDESPHADTTDTHGFNAGAEILAKVTVFAGARVTAAEA